MFILFEKRKTQNLMKQQLQTLIAEGKTDEAIQKLLTLANQIKKKDFHQEVIIQSARFEKYNQSNRMGISSSQEEGISIAKINKALLDIIDRLSDHEATHIEAKTKESFIPIDLSPSSKWWKWVVGLGLLIAIPAGIADFTGYSLKDLFSSSSTASNTVTVLVHGIEGKEDLILPNRGIVKLIYGDAIVSKPVSYTHLTLPTKA